MTGILNYPSIRLIRKTIGAGSGAKRTILFAAIIFYIGVHTMTFAQETAPNNQEAVKAYREGLHLIKDEVALSKKRIEEATTHLNEDQKTDLFDKLHASLMAPEDTLLLAKYGQAAIDYKVDGAALMVDRQNQFKYIDYYKRIEETKTSN